MKTTLVLQLQSENYSKSACLMMLANQHDAIYVSYLSSLLLGFHTMFKRHEEIKKNNQYMFKRVSANTVQGMFPLSLRRCCVKCKTYV